MSKALTIKEVAERLGVTTITIRNELKDGNLKAFRVRSSWRIREEDLQEYIQERLQRGENNE